MFIKSAHPNGPQGYSDSTCPVSLGERLIAQSMGIYWLRAIATWLVAPSVTLRVIPMAVLAVGQPAYSIVLSEALWHWRC
jgi:hypothetical protein